MSTALETRRAVAQELAQQLSAWREVSAVLVFGSVASGHVDDLSDIDMLLVCEPEIPSLAVRREQVSGLGEGWTFGITGDPMFPVIDECRSVDGVPVTLHYQEAGWLADVLEAVLLRGATTTEQVPFRPYTLAGLLSRAWVLEDAQGTVAGWRARTAVFPPVLRRNLLAHFVPKLQEHTDELLANARRNIGPVAFIFNLNWAVDALAGILYALNGVYDPADRRAERTIWPHFRLAPENFSARLSGILYGPFDDKTARQKAQAFAALATEVLALVKRT